MLNILNYTSLEVYCIKKGGLCLIDIKRAFVPKEEDIRTN